MFHCGHNHHMDSTLLAHSLEELIDKADAGEQAAKGVEELLQNPAVMNSVFFDPKELDEMYEQLLSLGGQQAIATAIENGITKGIESIAPERARMMYPEAVRCLLLYIRFLERPLDEEDVVFDRQGKVTSVLMEAILGLPFEGYKAFL